MSFVFPGGSGLCILEAMRIMLAAAPGSESLGVMEDQLVRARLLLLRLLLSLAEASGSWSSLYQLWIDRRLSRALLRDCAPSADVESYCSQLEDLRAVSCTSAELHRAFVLYLRTCGCLRFFHQGWTHLTFLSWQRRYF